MENKYTPQNDLYKYVNNGWLSKTKIPDDETSWGTFSTLSKENMRRIRKIVETNKNTKYNILYNQGMDMKTRNKLHITPVLPYLKYIDTEQNLTKLITKLHIVGSSCFFGCGEIADKNDSDYSRMIISQSGLGLPNKLYYFDKDKEKIRTEYKKYIARILLLFNFKRSNITHLVKIIYNIEKTVANISLSPVELRDVKKMYNDLTTKKIHKINNVIDWNYYLKHIGISDPDKKMFYIHNVKYFTNLKTIMNNPNIKLFIKWNLINSFTSSLSHKIYMVKFNFYSKILNGQQIPSKLWKRNISIANSNVGEEIGQIYVKKYYNNRKKKLITDMLHNIKYTFNNRIKKLDWMSEKTKEKACIKLKKMRFKIGHPTKWLSYKNLSVNKTNTYVQNLINCNIFHFKDEIKKCYKKKDKSLWEMYPQTINAYYHPLYNEMVFPAGIFQKPFFNEDRMVDSYSGIGTIIAHEITHGFDDKGSLYDADGNLNNWWTPGDRSKFMIKTEKIVKQYNNYKCYGVNVNGSLTQGENIADLGGIIVSFHAFQKYIVDNCLSTNLNKQFFYNYAKCWRNKQRKESVIKKINTDPHSPSIFRVNGVVSNFPEYYKIFNVTSKDKLYKKDIIKIW